MGCGDRDVGCLASMGMRTMGLEEQHHPCTCCHPLQVGPQGDAEPRAGVGAWDCPSLSAPCRTCLLPSPVILALWFLWVRVTPGVVPAGHERKTFHNGNHQPLESLPQGSAASPSVGYIQVPAGQGAGLSCLDCTCDRKGCTKCSLWSFPTWHSVTVCCLLCSDLSVSISDLLSSSEVTPWVLL